MNCREFIEFLLDYFAGELAPEVRLLFQEHLGECPDCVNYLAMYEQTMTLSKQCCAEETLPEDVPEELIRAILAARPC